MLFLEGMGSWQRADLVVVVIANNEFVLMAVEMAINGERSHSPWHVLRVTSAYRSMLAVANGEQSLEIDSSSLL